VFGVDGGHRRRGLGRGHPSSSSFLDFEPSKYRASVVAVTATVNLAVPPAPRQTVRVDRSVEV
jgi:hypothetical protein